MGLEYPLLLDFYQCLAILMGHLLLPTAHRLGAELRLLGAHVEESLCPQRLFQFKKHAAAAKQHPQVDDDFDGDSYHVDNVCICV